MEINTMFGRILLISIYFALVSMFGVFLQWSDVLGDLFCYFCSHEQNPKEYDYIIVGGGSAGSIIANRLAKDKSKRILLLEAGKYDSDLFHIPAMGLLLQNSPYDWKYKTVSQDSGCFGLENNCSIWPMGKILGGTSMLNNMLYTRGHKRDFDEWFKNKGSYKYSDILYYYKVLEKHSIFVRDIIFHTVLPEIILKAAKYLGYQTLEDNLDCQIGYSAPKAVLADGKRWTSANTLKQNKDKNMHIQLGCLVEEVLFKSNYEAYGVRYSYLGKKYEVGAKLGVVLSAGVIGSPKILMLSGIGNSDHLKEVEITPKIDLPVGENLQDHITTGFDLVLVNKILDLGIGQMLNPLSMWSYLTKGTGPLTTTGCELMAFFNTNNASEQPDLQFMIMPLSIREDDGVYLRKLMGITDITYSTYFSANQKTSITILPVVLHPKSRGFVKLSNRNPQDPPIIDPKYLSHRDDVETLIRGIDLIKQLVHSPELRLLGAEINKRHFPGCEKHHFDSREYWECYVRHLTITAYHPVGTCKMGHSDDPSTVINFDFQVKKTNKLYVVDGSVLPTLSSGNVNGAILMLAEMASDIIKKTEFLNKGKCRVFDLFLFKNVC